MSPSNICHTIFGVIARDVEGEYKPFLKDMAEEELSVVGLAKNGESELVISGLPDTVVV